MRCLKGGVLPVVGKGDDLAALSLASVPDTCALHTLFAHLVLTASQDGACTARPLCLRETGSIRR